MANTAIALRKAAILKDAAESAKLHERMKALEAEL